VVRPPQGTVVLLFHKPRRVVCTVRDDRGRRTVMDFFRAFRERLYPVGRLDAQSQGMLVVTNDGELTNRLTHPRYGVSRTYHVVVEGEVGDAILQRLRRGVWLAEGKTAPIDTIVKKRERRATVLEVTVREGMNREVRRVFAKFGLEVSHLKRIRIGDLPLGSLPEGAYRRLEPSDIELMLRAAKPGPAPPKNRGVRRMGKPSPDLARSEEE
jgi:23S rRNA pseudouridine2605 synthase